MYGERCGVPSPRWNGPRVLPYRALNYARESFLLPRKSPSRPIPSRPSPNTRPSVFGRLAERDFDAANQKQSTKPVGWHKNRLRNDNPSYSHVKIVWGKKKLFTCWNKSLVSFISSTIMIKFGWYKTSVNTKHIYYKILKIFKNKIDICQFLLLSHLRSLSSNKFASLFLSFSSSWKVAFDDYECVSKSFCKRWYKYLMIIVSRVSQSGHRIIGSTYDRPIKSERARRRTAEQ